MTRHYGSPGKLVERLDPTVFTAPRRRSAGRMVRDCWLQALAFVVALFVVFLFFAFNVPGV